jgi:predicted nuclease of predicted toxin-antitoxin system
MKILVDMNLPPKIVEFLGERGLAAKHWFSIGASDANDSEIFSYARQHEYIVLTCDLDFTALLAASKFQKPSVIQIRVQGVV